MKNVSAVLLKQMKETLKNKTILIQFLMFPVMTIILENAIKMEDMPEHYFAKMFAVPVPAPTRNEAPNITVAIIRSL